MDDEDDENLAPVDDVLSPQGELVAPLDAFGDRMHSDYTDANGEEWVSVLLSRETLDQHVMVVPRRGEEIESYSVDRDDLRCLIG